MFVLLDSALLQFAHEHNSDWSLCSDVLVDETKLWVCTSQELHSRSLTGLLSSHCCEASQYVLVM